jgi:hypothetical protein
MGDELFVSSITLFQDHALLFLTTGPVRLPHGVRVSSIRSSTQYIAREIPPDIRYGDFVVVYAHDRSVEGIFLSKNDKSVTVSSMDGSKISVINRYSEIVRDGDLPGVYLDIPGNTDISFAMSVSWQAHIQLYVDSWKLVTTCYIVNNTATTIHANDLEVSTGGEQEPTPSARMLASLPTSTVGERQVWKVGPAVVPCFSRVSLVLSYSDVRVEKIYWNDISHRGVTYTYRITGNNVLIPSGDVEVYSDTHLLGSSHVRETLLSPTNYLDVQMGYTSHVTCISSVQVGKDQIVVSAEVTNNTGDVLYLVLHAHEKRILRSTVPYEARDDELLFRVMGSGQFEATLTYEHETTN